MRIKRKRPHRIKKNQGQIRWRKRRDRKKETANYWRDGERKRPLKIYEENFILNNLIIIMDSESLGIMSEAYRISRKELLDWINETLSLNLHKVE